jgi:hypothetical protein
MALTDEEIAKLLAKQPRNRSGGRTGKGKIIDVSVRDYTTWFALAHKMFDEGTKELIKCSNPNCRDTREKQLCAEVHGTLMCRMCFLDGWLLFGPEQTTLDDNGD